jgi:radical SAM protein with 4Fe4S-binding SPASM domain
MSALLAILTRLRSRGLARSLRSWWYHRQAYLRYSTWPKLRNFMALKVQRLLGRDVVSGLPYRYRIEAISVCNLHCPLCPTGTGALAQSRGEMALSDFQRIVDSIAPYAYRLDLFNLGEPFLHKDIFAMIRYARSKGIAVRFSTNLNHFDARMAEETVASGLDELIVAIDGADQEVYQKYRIGGKLETVLNNLKLLLAARRAANQTTPLITALTVVTKQNEAQVPAIQRLVEDLGVDDYIPEPAAIDPTKPQDIAQWLPSSRYDYYGRQTRRSPIMAFACFEPWEACVIKPDGTVLPCCWFHDVRSQFGNVLSEPLAQIWNNEHYVSARRALADRGKTATQHTLCADCLGKPAYKY